MPPDEQRPVLSLLRLDTALTVIPCSTFHTPDFVHVSDFEDSEPLLIYGLGGDTLQLYTSNPQLAARLPFNARLNAHGPLTVTFSAADEAGNEADPIQVPVYISSPSSPCSDAELLWDTGTCSSQGLCLPQNDLDFLSASGLLSGSFLLFKHCIFHLHSSLVSYIGLLL